MEQPDNKPNEEEVDHYQGAKAAPNSRRLAFVSSERITPKEYEVSFKMLDWGDPSTCELIQKIVLTELVHTRDYDFAISNISVTEAKHHRCKNCGLGIHRATKEECHIDGSGLRGHWKHDLIDGDNYTYFGCMTAGSNANVIGKFAELEGEE